MSPITNVVVLEHDSDKVPPSHQEVIETGQIETGQMRALDMHRLVLHVSLIPSHPNLFLTCVEEHRGHWGRG